VLLTGPKESEGPASYAKDTRVQ